MLFNKKRAVFIGCIIVFLCSICFFLGYIFSENKFFSNQTFSNIKTDEGKIIKLIKNVPDKINQFKNFIYLRPGLNDMPKDCRASDYYLKSIIKSTDVFAQKITENKEIKIDSKEIKPELYEWLKSNFSDVTNGIYDGSNCKNGNSTFDLGNGKNFSNVENQIDNHFKSLISLMKFFLLVSIQEAKQNNLENSAKSLFASQQFYQDIARGSPLVCHSINWINGKLLLSGWENLISKADSLELLNKIDIQLDKLYQSSPPFELALFFERLYVEYMAFYKVLNLKSNPRHNKNFYKTADNKNKSDEENQIEYSESVKMFIDSTGISIPELWDNFEQHFNKIDNIVKSNDWNKATNEFFDLDNQKFEEKSLIYDFLHRDKIIINLLLPEYSRFWCRYINYQSTLFLIRSAIEVKKKMIERKNISIDTLKISYSKLDKNSITWPIKNKSCFWQPNENPIRSIIINKINNGYKLSLIIPQNCKISSAKTELSININ